MKVIVAGGRDFLPDKKHTDWLLLQFNELKITELVCGMARGADLFGYSIAKEMNISIKEFPALWEKYGKSAGYKRNEQMAQYAEACILFPGGKGTKHMENLANKYNLKIIKWEISKNDL